VGIRERGRRERPRTAPPWRGGAGRGSLGRRGVGDGRLPRPRDAPVTRDTWSVPVAAAATCRRDSAMRRALPTPQRRCVTDDALNMMGGGGLWSRLAGRRSIFRGLFSSPSRLKSHSSEKRVRRAGQKKGAGGNGGRRAPPRGRASFASFTHEGRVSSMSHAAPSNWAHAVPRRCGPLKIPEFDRGPSWWIEGARPYGGGSRQLEERRAPHRGL